MKRLILLYISLLTGVVLHAENRTNAAQPLTGGDLPGSVIHS
jgi:hypothetical protein